MNDSKVTSAHLARTAVVYRQSTLIQVERNRESTLRQYELAGRAAELGWPRPAIRVIDADLGVSGSGLAARAGFAELTEQIALGQVGSCWRWRSPGWPAPRPSGIACSICAGSPAP